MGLLMSYSTPPPSAFSQDVPPPGGFPKMKPRLSDMPKGTIPFAPRTAKWFTPIQLGMVVVGMSVYGFYTWGLQIRRTRKYFIERDIEHREVNRLANDYALKRLIEGAHKKVHEHGVEEHHHPSMWWDNHTRGSVNTYIR